MSKENEFIEKLVHVNRITKVVKGGRRFGFAAIMIVGDTKGRVGIGTTNLGSKLNVNGSVQLLDSLTVGVTARKCAVDFSDAGKNASGALANKMFMLPPRLSTSSRNALTGLVSGAIIYNTSNNKLQVYNGSGWDNCN